MRAFMSLLLFLVIAALVGAQIMLGLEGNAFPLLTLAQSAALMWVAEPFSASQSVDAAMEGSSFLTMLLSLPALPIAFGLWLISLLQRRK